MSKKASNPPPPRPERVPGKIQEGTQIEPKPPTNLRPPPPPPPPPPKKSDK